MKIYLKRDAVLDQIILVIMMLQVMIFRWLGIQDEINIVLLILIALSFLSRYRIALKQLAILFLLVFGAYQFLNYLILGGNTRFLMRNGYRTIKSIVFIVYLSFLFRYKRQVCIGFLRNLFWVLNLYMLINIPVLLLQLNGHYSLAAYHKFYDLSTASANFYKDLTSGLFGRYGTPCLAFYAVFLAIYNYMYGKTWVSKRYKAFLSVYNIIILIFNLIMATLNDNKGLYIVFAIIIMLLYLFLENARIIRRFGSSRGAFIKVATRAILFIILFGVVVVALYKYSPGFRTNIANMLLQKIYEGISLGNDVKGGGERLGMIVFILSTPSKLLLGYGLGNYSPTADTLGFLHFGLADFGTYLCLGGLVYIVLLFLIVYKAIDFDSRKSLSILTLITVIIFSIYTQVFSNTSTTICMMYIYWICWMAHDWKKGALANE